MISRKTRGQYWLGSTFVEIAMIVDVAGSLYGFAGDIRDRLEWEEAEKVVDRDWLVRSEFEEKMVGRGLTLYWSRPDHIAARELDGYSVLYEIDMTNRARCRLVLHDGTTLIGKPVEG
jgi:hypothetical protein